MNIKMFITENKKAIFSVVATFAILSAIIVAMPSTMAGVNQANLEEQTASPGIELQVNGKKAISANVNDTVSLQWKGYNNLNDTNAICYTAIVNTQNPSRAGEIPLNYQWKGLRKTVGAERINLSDSESFLGVNKVYIICVKKDEPNKEWKSDEVRIFVSE